MHLVVESLISRTKRHPSLWTLFLEPLFVYYIPDIGIVVASRDGNILTKADFTALCTDLEEQYGDITPQLIREAVILREIRPTGPVNHTRSRDPLSGFIYLLSGGGYYKIGLTTDVDRRISEISPKLPFEVELIHVIQADDMTKAESYLHERFSDKRVNGEWFRLSSDDVEWIKGLDSIEVNDGQQNPR
jgi:hypothetical protein